MKKWIVGVYRRLSADEIQNLRAEINALNKLRVAEQKKLNQAIKLHNQSAYDESNTTVKNLDGRIAEIKKSSDERGDVAAEFLRGSGERDFGFNRREFKRADIFAVVPAVHDDWRGRSSVLDGNSSARSKRERRDRRLRDKFCADALRESGHDARNFAVGKFYRHNKKNRHSERRRKNCRTCFC